MNKNREKLHWHRSLVVTVILILLMVAASFVITGWISREEEERSFTRLRQEAGQVAGRIEEMTETDGHSWRRSPQLLPDTETLWMRRCGICWTPMWRRE